MGAQFKEGMETTRPTEPSWSPVVSPPFAEKCEEVVRKILVELECKGRDPNQPSLGGAAGLALLYATAARVFGEERLQDKASEYLEFVLNGLEKVPLSVSLWGGLVGSLWALTYLEVPVEGVAEVQDQLEQHVSTASRGSVSYDLISGLVGIGVYGRSLGRDHPIFRAVVDRLIQWAVVDDMGARWATPASLLDDQRRTQFPDGLVDLGIAHGGAGVIALLSSAVPGRPELRPLLQEAVKWQRLRCLPDSRRWAGFFSPDGPALPPARDGWCYGAPGIGAAMLAAGVALGSSETMTLGREILSDVTRRSARERAIVDAGLCHGTAGTALVMMRAAQNGNDELAAFARQELAATLEYGSRAEGIGGFMSYHHESGWRLDASLFTGATGIALALLAAISSTPPDWDQLLLLSD